jgi:hypothetical protein
MTPMHTLTEGAKRRALLTGRDPYLPYFGKTTRSKRHKLLKVKTAPMPLRVVLTLLLERTVAETRNSDVLALVDHMTPGLNFWLGLTSNLPRYALDVCGPELRKQFPELANEQPAEGEELDAFHMRMQERFGMALQVKSIPIPLIEA